MKSPKIILAGGTGFLGRLLTQAFAADHCEVVVLTRSASSTGGPARQVAWDGRTLGPWTRELEGAEAVINLAGRSVDCRYHARNRRVILESRIFPTTVIGEAIGRCQEPPWVWINASTATIYKHSFERPMDESGEIGGTREAKDEFSVEVATAWEKAFAEASVPATRKVGLRLAMVFSSTDGTVFRVLRRLVRLGLGGSMAGGRQYVSWIHEEDFCRAVRWIVRHETLSGPVNVASPFPLSNSEMMQILRRVCGRPFGLPAALWMLEVGAFFLRTETELIIKSRRVVPGKLLQAGFQFDFPRFAEAVNEIEKRVGKL